MFLSIRLKSSFGQHGKLLLNRALGAVGFEIRSTSPKRSEQAHWETLRQSGHWSTPQYSEGIAFNQEAFRDFLKSVCRPYQADYIRLPENGDPASTRFYLNNPGFNDVDAQVLYSIIRSFRPQQIVEAGSGFSTMLMRQAIEDGGLTTKMLCVDPMPRASIDRIADEHRAERIEDLPIDEIVAKLSANDILFIDSSHTVQIAGDIPFLLLRVLPRLAPGTLVQVHDVFLPFEVPERYIISGNLNWAEQYMVHALLYGSHEFEILFASRYVWEYMKSDVQTNFPGAWPRHGQVPSSLWLRKTEHVM
jgi:predicted O-methyltransferase YrrM